MNTAPAIYSESLLKPSTSTYINSTILGYFILLTISLVFGNYLILGSYDSQFWLLTGVITLHNLVEITLIYKAKSRHFWFQPVVLGSIVLFMLQFGGITNYLYTDEEGRFFRSYNEYLINEPVWLAKSMSLVLAASVLYWLGYKLPVGRILSNIYLRYYSKFWNFTVSHSSLLLGLVIGWGVKLLLNYYGGIGHRLGLVIAETGELPPIAARLKIFEDLSLVFMIAFLFLAYKSKKNILYWFIFLVALVIEVIFALNSGTRGMLIYVFIAVFMVDYFYRGKISLIWAAAGIGVFIFAMTVLDAFKAYALNPSNQVINVKDPIAYIENALEYRNKLLRGSSQNESSKRDFYLHIVGRFNHVNEVAQFVRYKNVHGLDANDPDFLSPMFTFPLFAIVPRYYILGQENVGYGGWVTRVLTGSKRYSIAISSMGYSYMAGGTLMVLIVFGVVGVLMKFAGKLFMQIRTVIAFILFLALLKVLVQFDTVVWSSFLNLIRYAIFLPIVFWLLLRRYAS